MKNEIQSYKGRVIDPVKPIRIYRNLNKPGVVYSIKQGNLVVSHATQLHISGCTCEINHTVRERVKANRVKEVHAYIKGHLTEADFEPQCSVRYNPYEFNYFFTEDIAPIRVAVNGGAFMGFGPSGVTVGGAW